MVPKLTKPYQPATIGPDPSFIIPRLTPTSLNATSLGPGNHNKTLCNLFQPQHNQPVSWPRQHRQYHRQPAKILPDTNKAGREDPNANTTSQAQRGTLWIGAKPQGATLQKRERKESKRERASPILSLFLLLQGKYCTFLLLFIQMLLISLSNPAEKMCVLCLPQLDQGDSAAYSFLCVSRSVYMGNDREMVGSEVLTVPFRQ